MPSDGDVLTWNSALSNNQEYAAPAGGPGGGYPDIETSLPGSPTDLDEIYLQVGSGDTAVYWHLKYIDAITDSYPWIYLGGSALYDLHSASASTSSGTYVELNSGQPQVTLPAIGVYEFTHGCLITTDAINDYGIQNVKTNGSNPGDDIEAAHFSYGNTTIGARAQTHVNTFERTVSSIGSSALAVNVYRVGGTVDFANRFLSVRPVRLG